MEFSSSHVNLIFPPFLLEDFVFLFLCPFKYNYVARDFLSSCHATFHSVRRQLPGRKGYMGKGQKGALLR